MIIISLYFKLLISKIYYLVYWRIIAPIINYIQVYKSYYSNSKVFQSLSSNFFLYQMEFYIDLDLDYIRNFFLNARIEITFSFQNPSMLIFFRSDFFFILLFIKIYNTSYYQYQAVMYILMVVLHHFLKIPPEISHSWEK